MSGSAGPALVDAHCHFDLFPNPQRVLKEAERRRIYCIAVTNTPSVFEPMKWLTDGLKYVRPALGLHPQLAIQRASELPLFSQLISSTRYVGEVGLDYMSAATHEARARQRAIFEAILRRCADDGGKVLTVHSRRAEADVVAALQEYSPGPFILHWYSGSMKTLEVAVAAGARFSVNLAMIRSDRGRRLIREMPRDRVLTESDGPFVELEGAPASPSSVSGVVAQLGTIWDIEAEQASAQVLENLKSLLGLLPR